MSRVIVGVVLLMGGLVVVWLAVYVAAAVAVAWVHAWRADRCSCGRKTLIPVGGVPCEAWITGGVRHERNRCMPLRETV